MKRFVPIIIAAICCAGSSWAQWVFQSLGPPQGGNLVVARPIDENIVWIAKDQGYARTTDGGLTWTQGPIPSAPHTYRVLDIAAFDAETAWIATYDTSGQTTGGIFKTSDGGITWTLQISAIPGAANYYLSAVVFFDANDGICLGETHAQENFEIYTTTDGGVNWLRVPNAQLPPLPNPAHGEHFGLRCQGTHGNCLWFATCQGRIIRTTDRGKTWSSSTAGNTIYGPLTFRDSLNGIYTPYGSAPMRTTDGGVTWSSLPIPAWIPIISPSESYYMPTYVPGQTNTIIMAAEGSNGIDNGYVTAISTDGGVSWSRMGWVEGSWPSFSQSGVGWMSGNGGIFKWPAYTGRHICRCAPSIRYAAEVGSSDADEFVSIGNYGTESLTVTSLSVNGVNFALINPPAAPFALDPWEVINLKVAYVPTARGPAKDSLVIMSNATNAPVIGVALSGKGLLFNDVYIGPNMYAVADTLYSVSNETGAASQLAALDVGPIHGLALDPTNHTLYGITTGTDSSVLFRIDPSVPGAIPVATIPLGYVRAIAFSPQGTMFGGTNLGVLLRIDPSTGETTTIGSARGKAFAAFSFSPSGQLYACAMPSQPDRDAIYIIDTTKGSATLVGKTGDNAATPSIAFDAAGNLFGLKETSTEENKIIRIDTGTGVGTEIGSTGVAGLQAITMINTVVSIEDRVGDGMPPVFTLLQNYPNPFNPSTTIRYELPYPSDVTLKVFNILGQEILTLLEEHRPAGFHTVQFDASGLANGVYIYWMIAGDFVQTKKLIVLR